MRDVRRESFAKYANQSILMFKKTNSIAITIGIPKKFYVCVCVTPKHKGRVNIYKLEMIFRITYFVIVIIFK